MKIFIAPDKFKGSLTTFGVCKAISAGIKKGIPGAAFCGTTDLNASEIKALGLKKIIF
jgi:glycerate kinase